MLIGSPHVQEYLEGFAVGATMQNRNQSILLKMSVGFPPLAEQHCIVAKVDELMGLCDRLEASPASGDDTRWRLLDELLHEALAPSEERIRRDIPMISQEPPAKTPGPPKVLTGSTTIGSSPK